MHNIKSLEGAFAVYRMMRARLLTPSGIWDGGDRARKDATSEERGVGKGRHVLSPPSTQRPVRTEVDQVSVFGGRPLNVIDNYDVRRGLSRLQPEAKLFL